MRPQESAPVGDIEYICKKMDQVIQGYRALPPHSDLILAMICLTKDTRSGGKFWVGSVAPSQFELRWGKNGTNGQKRISTKASVDLALDELKNRAVHKIREGYAVVRQDSIFNH